MPGRRVTDWSLDFESSLRACLRTIVAIVEEISSDPIGKKKKKKKK
jgi:hypothetical protein